MCKFWSLIPVVCYRKQSVRKSNHPVSITINSRVFSIGCTIHTQLTAITIMDKSSLAVVLRDFNSDFHVNMVHSFPRTQQTKVKKQIQ